MNTFLFILANILCILACTIFMQGIAHQNGKKRKSLLEAAMMTCCIIALDISIFSSLSIPLHIPFLYITMYCLLFFLCMYMTLEYTKKKPFGIINIYRANVIIASNILLIHYGLNLYILRDSLHVHIDQIVVACVLVTGTVLYTLRLFLQLSQANRSFKVQILKHTAITLTGISLVTATYMSIQSVSDIELHNSDILFYGDSPLAPYTIGVTILLILSILPSVYGEQKLQEKEQNYISIFRNHPNPVFALNYEGYFTIRNQETAHFFELADGDLPKHSFLEFVPPSHIEEAVHYFAKARSGDANRCITKIVTPHGTAKDVSVTFIPMKSDGNVSGVYTIVYDITKEKQTESKIRFLAYHDELTGLPNRRNFMETVQQLEKNVETTREPFAVIFIDMDRFKQFNDLFGHDFGDQLIYAVTKRIQEAVPDETYILYRIGGDEFTIIVSDALNENTIEQALNDIIRHVAQPLLIDSVECYVTCSVGIAYYPKDGTSSSAILRNADKAMYEAKLKGKNNVQRYTSDMDKSNNLKGMLETGLQKALENHEFILHYQPKLYLSDTEVTSAEALIRWKHPVFGMVSPGEFIPIAEETGFIVQLEYWVMHEVCRQLQTWKKNGFPSVRIAINLSHRHIYQESFVERMIDILQQYDVHPQQIELEITESLMMQDTNSTIEKLHELKRHGFIISMDDFGTGYSSLSYLKRLPIDMLKIDRSFITDVLDNPDADAIIAMIISMAQHLNLTTVAEGVETAKQAEYLLELGCQEAQGFYFSRPLPIDELEAYLLQTTKA